MYHKFNKSSLFQINEGEVNTGYSLRDNTQIGSSLGSVINGLQILVFRPKKFPASGGISILKSQTRKIHI